MEKTLSYGSNVYPGAQVDMFSGMKAGFKDPFFYLKPARQNNRSIVLHKSAEFSLEPFPILTACDTWEQLAAVLFGGFSIEGRYQGFAGGAVVKSGFAEAQKEKVKFADLLEMDTAWLDSEKYGYVVAEIPRRLKGKTDKLTEEEEKNLRGSIADELERLKADLRKNQVGNVLTDEENIQKILDVLQQKCGTHYIKEVRQGDDIFQIFVYEKEGFRYVCCCMDKNGWEGYQALGFRFFTSSEYCCHAGKVKMKSGSGKVNRLRECLADPVYNLEESVFCLPGNQEAYRIIDEIDDVVCLEASLIPVYDVCTDEPLVYETVVQGCIAGFGETAAGPLACRNDNETDYGRLYSDFGRMDMMTALWTPMLSFSQMYICLDDLLNMKSVNRDVLKHLALCADVLEVKGMLDLRFLESITLVCRKLICHTSPELCGIILSKQAYDTMDIYCEEAEGSLQIMCQDGETSGGLLYARYAAMLTFDRGICLRGSYAGRTPSEILTCPTGIDYLSEWKKNAMQTGFQTVMSAAAVPLMAVNQSSGGLEVMREAWECIQWVCECYQNAILYTQDEAEKQRFSKVYASAVSVMRNTVNPYEPQSEYIPSVSVLSFEAYEKTVNRFMELCKDYEDKIQTVKEEIRAYNEKLEVHYEADKLRDNLKEFADFFDAQNQSLDDIYKEVEKNEREIHHQISQELLDLTRQDEDITSKMEKYNNELSGKLENLNQAIKKKIATESVKAAFKFLGALCTIVGQIGRAWCNWSLLSSAPEAERTLKRWEAFLNSMEAVNSATQLGIDIDDTVAKISDWNTVCPSYTEAPTALDWELTLHEIDAEITPLEADFAKEVSEYRAFWSASLPARNSRQPASSK